MKICKDGACPIDNVAKCCIFCEKKDTCQDACENSRNNIIDCVLMDDVADVLELLKNNQVATISKIYELEKQAQKIKEQSEKMREELLKAMELYGVKKFENDVISITYKAESVRESIDTTRLKKELPKVAQDFTKTSNVKSSITIKLKD